MRLDGPLQAYGTHARFELRDTGTHPTVSAVTGMIACALGWSRETPLGPLADLEIAVRVDQPGRILRDFQTVGIEGWRSAAGKVTKGEAKLCTRFYLQDAVFVVAVGHPDPDLIARIDEALARPYWPVYLGRKSCPPAAPIRIGTRDQDPLDALATLAYQGHRPVAPATLTVVVTDPTGAGEAVQDVPLGFDSRRYTLRTTRRDAVPTSQPSAPNPPRPVEDWEDNPYGI
jgi:CRISPR system Cascade subunit CasD